MQRSLGLAISARAIATICCSPPESVPASWSRRSLRRGNSSNTRSRSACDLRLVGAGEGSHLEVLEHGHPRETAGAPRAPARCRGGRARAVRQRVDGLAGVASPCRAWAHEPEDGLHRGRLARGVAAEQAHDLALVDPVVHALEHVKLAVVGVDVGELKKRRPLARRGCASEIGTQNFLVAVDLLGLGPRRSSRRGRARSPCRRSR